MKEIIFKIDEDGEIHMEVKGATGSACDEFTAPYEENLGSISNKERKAEYFAEENTKDYVGDSYEE